MRRRVSSDSALNVSLRVFVSRSSSNPAPSDYSRDRGSTILGAAVHQADLLVGEVRMEFPFSSW